MSLNDFGVWAPETINDFRVWETDSSDWVPSDLLPAAALPMCFSLV